MYTALCGIAVFALASGVQAQEEVKVSKVKINVDVQKTPRITGTGAKEKRDTQKQWFEIEVEFDVDVKKGDPKVEFLDELEFRYFVAMQPRGAKTPIAYTATVNHIDIPNDGTSVSVVYMAPTTIAKLLGKNTAPNKNMLQIAVEIYHGGKLVGGDATSKASTRWWNDLPAVDGKVLNKTQTPFANLWFDRYVGVKQ